MSFKKQIKSVPFLGPFLRKKWQYYFLRDSNPTWLLEKECRNLKEAYVVQVGSNDGKTGDPVYPLLKKHSDWRAVFIEPVPFLFERLQRNYLSDSKYIFENVAIGLQQEQKNFFYVDAKAKANLRDLPEWFDQLGSFDKDHITRHFGDKVNDYIVCVKVPVMPLQAVLDANHIRTIDILHIDTEGYDWIVLQQLDLEKYSPKVILFEYKHLAFDEKEKAISYLSGHYEIRDLGSDFFCRKL